MLFGPVIACAQFKGEKSGFLYFVVSELIFAVAWQNNILLFRAAEVKMLLGWRSAKLVEDNLLCLLPLEPDLEPSSPFPGNVCADPWRGCAESVVYEGKNKITITEKKKAKKNLFFKVMEVIQQILMRYKSISNANEGRLEGLSQRGWFEFSSGCSGWQEGKMGFGRGGGWGSPRSTRMVFQLGIRACSPPQPLPHSSSALESSSFPQSSSSFPAPKSNHTQCGQHRGD